MPLIQYNRITYLMHYYHQIEYKRTHISIKTNYVSSFYYPVWLYLAIHDNLSLSKYDCLSGMFRSSLYHSRGRVSDYKIPPICLGMEPEPICSGMEPEPICFGMEPEPIC